jgi:flagellar FliL protein
MADLLQVKHYVPCPTAVLTACAPNTPTSSCLEPQEPAAAAVFSYGMLIAHSVCPGDRNTPNETLRNEKGREEMPPEEEQKEIAKKPKSKKLLIILPLLVVLLAGGGAGAYFKFGRASSEVVEEKKHEEAPIYHELDTFMVNLADPGGKRFLKATIKVKVSSPNVAEECKLRGFEIRDLVLLLLSSKESEEISRSEDKLALKKQMIEALNGILRKGQALDVYFTEFLIQ